MEPNPSNITKSAQKGYAFFELVCTALILLAVSTSCVLEQLGHSPDTLPIFKAFGSFPLNSAVTLNFLVDNKELSIGIVLIFSIACIFNICLKFADLTSGPTKTNWLSWIVTLSGGAFFWYFVYFAIRVVDEAKHDHSLFASKNVLDFGTGLVLLAIADFVLFLGMAFKRADETTPKANMTSASNVEENKEVIDESISTPIDAESISGNTPVLEGSIAEPLQEPKDENIVEIEEEEKTSWFEENKKWLFPVGGVVALALVIWGAFSIFSGGKGNDILPVQKPAWEKFVVVLNDEVAVFKEAKTISPKLEVMVEEIDSDVPRRYFKWDDTPNKRGYSSFFYKLYSNRILPVVGEEGEWYKVVVSDDEIGFIDCYVQKTYCREAKPEPITPELLKELRSYKGSDAWFGLQTEGKYKDICFISSNNEFGGSWLDLAVLHNGVLINPLTKHIMISSSEEDGPLFEVNYNEAYEMSILTCGKQLQGGDGWLDAQLIIQEAKNGVLNLDSFFESIPTSQSSIQLVSYYFPEINKENLYTFYQDLSSNQSSGGIDGVEDKNFTGFTYVLDNGEYGLELFAEVNGERKSTNISGERVDILDQADYDDDGELEALVYAWGGGNAIEPPFIVYFDKETQEFKKAEGFNDANAEPEIKVESWKGKPSFRVDVGLRKDRYVYKDHSVDLVECIVPNVGIILSTITVDQLFGSSEEPEDKTANIDIDGDGEKDKVIFFHDTSHFLGWGKQMMLKDFTGSYWFWADSEREDMGVIGSKFAFIKPEVGEVPNILTDDAWFYKWIDGKYVLQ